MSLDALFSAGNLVALAGWLLLLASPFLPAWTRSIPQLLIPALLGIAYTGLILANWSGAEGGFSSLDEVAALFASREVLLAGWLHYLAFDLFVGAWEVEAARAARLAFWLVVPCLVLTFLFGPVGLLLFLAVRAIAARTLTSHPAQGALS